ncbi:MAG: cellobiose phosphorylase, partial [Clostridiales bacterium]|nr:cellobiose phosphorylase [Clostridiales bacterium]
MDGYSYLDKNGTFRIYNPELTSYLYFPIANESGVMGSITPTLAGDNKMGQNTFLLEPVTIEDLHNNNSSRNFWCNVKGKGLWSATGKSAAQEAMAFTDKKEETVLDAGFMWHQLRRVSKEYGITSEITSFVPSNKDTLEIMLVRLINSGEEDITFTATAAIPLYGRSADNIRDHRHVTSLLHRVETTEAGVVLNPTLTFDERGHQKNTVVYGVFGSEDNGQEPVGFYPIAGEFIGEGGSFVNPRTLVRNDMAPVGKDFSRNGYEALGGIVFKEITLKAGEEKTYIITMCYGKTKEDLSILADSYHTFTACEKALVETKKYWLEKLNVKYKTAEPDFDAWMMWVNFQPILRRIYGCSFLPHHDYGKGGRGWRDLWQDCLALLIMNPSVVKNMIYDNFAGVRIDGSNATIIGLKQGEFIADRNNITRVWMDHGAWPFLTTKLYIMRTGDINLLLKENYYFKDIQAVRGEDKDYKWEEKDGNRLKTKGGKEYVGSLLEHMLVQHLTAFYDVGAHNHMRLRGADWNDALDMAKEHGESVAFTALYGDNMEQMAELLLKLKDDGTTHVPLLKELEPLINTDSAIYDVVKDKQDLLLSYCNSCKHTVSGDEILISCEELSANLRHKAEWIKEHIRKNEWLTNKEGYSWFNSYYDNHGQKVEGDFNLGVRMMLTGQVF